MGVRQAPIEEGGTIFSRKHNKVQNIDRDDWNEDWGEGINNKSKERCPKPKTEGDGVMKTWNVGLGGYKYQN